MTAKVFYRHRSQRDGLLSEEVSREELILNWSVRTCFCLHVADLTGF